MQDYSAYERHYSESGFWTIVRRYKNSIPFLRDALALFYCLKDPATPTWVRIAIVGALGYVILPMDLVPDFIPVAGWLDDAAVVAGVLGAIRSRIREEHWKQADEWLHRDGA